MTRTRTRLSNDDVKEIVIRAIKHTSTVIQGKPHLVKHDIGVSYHQRITVASTASRTSQMQQAYKIAEQCRCADEDYPMTSTSVQVDLTSPFKATIVIREY